MPGTKRSATYYRANTKVKRTKRGTYGTYAPTITSDKYVLRQGRTDYALSLIDPFKRIPVRIPDLACYETVTFTNEYHGQWKVSPTSAATDTGNNILLVGLHPGGWMDTIAGNGAGTNAANPRIHWQPGSSNTAGRYKAARLVSAAIKITYSDSDTSTAGEIIANFIPSDYAVIFKPDGSAVIPWNGTAPAGGLNTSGLPSTSNYDLTGDPGLGGSKLKALCGNYYEGPLRNGCYVRYKPQDSDSFDMTFVPRASQSDNIANKFGCFLIEALPAITSGTVSFQVDFVANYEGILLNNDLGIIAGVSMSDPGALAHGINAAAKASSAFGANGGSIAVNVDQILKSVT